MVYNAVTNKLSIRSMDLRNGNQRVQRLFQANYLQQVRAVVEYDLLPMASRESVIIILVIEFCQFSVLNLLISASDENWSASSLLRSSCKVSDKEIFHEIFIKDLRLFVL